MVTKLRECFESFGIGFVLAKKLMVTKLCKKLIFMLESFVLAKKLMVTKPQIHITINLRFYKM